MVLVRKWGGCSSVALSFRGFVGVLFVIVSLVENGLKLGLLEKLGFYSRPCLLESNALINLFRLLCSRMTFSVLLLIWNVLVYVQCRETRGFYVLILIWDVLSSPTGHTKMWCIISSLSETSLNWKQKRIRFKDPSWIKSSLLQQISISIDMKERINKSLPDRRISLRAYQTT